MRVTLSVLKADIGSVGGHTLPSPAVLAAVKEVVEEVKGSLLLDAYVFHIGDDIVFLLSHTRGWPTPPFTSSLSRPMVEVS